MLHPELFSGLCSQARWVTEGSAGSQARKVNPNCKTLEDNTPFLHIFSLVETVSNYHHTPGNLLKIQYIHLM